MKKDPLNELLGFYVNELRLIGIRNFDQLKKKCVGPKKTYIPLSFPNLQPPNAVNVNWCLASFFAKKKLVNDEERIKQLPITSYHFLIKRKSRKALAFNGLRTIRDIYEKCIVDGEFKSLRGKKIGLRTNYETALVLKHIKFLSEEAFRKVPLPSWKTRLLTDEEVGEDGKRKLYRMKWSKAAIEVIRHAINLKFPEISGIRKDWLKVTLGDLVKTFVRIDNNGNPIFYKKGHLGSRYYKEQWDTPRYTAALSEIELCLVEFGFIAKLEEQLVEEEMY